MTQEKAKAEMSLKTAAFAVSAFKPAKAKEEKAKSGRMSLEQLQRIADPDQQDPEEAEEEQENFVVGKWMISDP